MLYTNGKILIHAEGDIDALDASVNQLEDFLRDVLGPHQQFTYSDEPYPHYRLPEGVEYDQLKNVLGDDIKRRAINEQVMDVTDKTFTRSVKHWFTHGELERKADELVNAIKDRDEVEARKKVAMHQFNEELKNLDIDISKLAMHRRERFEMQDIECTKQLNLTDQKVYYLVDNEVVDVAEMEPKDRQMFINFDQMPSAFTDAGGRPMDEATMARERAELESMQVNLDKEG